MKKISIFVVLLTIITALNPVLASEINTDSDFLLTVVCEDSNEEINLSGTGINIYSSYVSNYDDKNDITEYSHSYQCTLYTNENGIITFKRPSECFLVILEDSSLPEGFLAKNDTILFYQDQNIGSIELVKQSGETNKNAVNVEEKTDHNIINTNTYFNECDKIILNVLNRIKNNEIDKNTAVDILLDTYNMYGTSGRLITALAELVNSLESSNDIPDDKLCLIKAILSPPTCNKTYSYGDFVIHYNYETDEIPQFITSLKDTLIETNSSLVTGFTLQRPQTDVMTHKYHVYVTNMEDSSVAYTIPYTSAGIRVSYIVIPNITNLSTNLSTFYKGTVAHEYMHAINHCYISLGSVGSWFKESWAEWARIHVYGIASSQVGWVNNYLEHIYYSLNENLLLDYGKVLFPLYLKQNHGGDATVAEIVKKLQIYGDEITAINSVLTNGSTLSSIFDSFMRFNYAPKHFYYIYSSGWSDHPYISEIYSSNVSSIPSTSITIEPLSAQYREFYVPSDGTYRYAITINGTTDFSGKLLMTKNTGDITNWSIGSGSPVTYSFNVNGNIYYKGCYMFTNKNDTNTTTFYFSMTRIKIN